MNEKRPPPFHWRAILGNFRYFSSLSFMLVKHPSETAAEAQVKVRPYYFTNRTVSFSTLLCALGSLGCVARLCLRSGQPWKKIAAVALYLGLLNDILYFGSNAGLALMLPYTMNELLRAPPETRVFAVAERIARITAAGDPLPDLDLVFRYLNDRLSAAEPLHAGFVQNAFYRNNPDLVPRVDAAPSFFYRYSESSPAWESLLGRADCLVTRRIARRAAAVRATLFR